jgi:hypothetical protein
LCSPVSKVKDERMEGLTFKVIDRLKSEKEILIAKAISWLRGPGRGRKILL